MKNKTVNVQDKKMKLPFQLVINMQARVGNLSSQHLAVAGKEKKCLTKQQTLLSSQDKKHAGSVQLCPLDRKHDDLNAIRSLRAR